MASTQFRVVTLDSGNTETIDFGTTVISASSAVQGYNVSFGSTDHNVKTLEVNTTASSTGGGRVSVSATCTMEDNSNNKATGKVDVLVIAYCEN